MKKTTLLILLLALTSIAFAQRGNQKWYNLAVGTRLEVGDEERFKNGGIFGNVFGITFEKAFSTVTSVEFLALTLPKEGIEFTGIYKYISPFPEVPPSFRWFVGIGAHIGSAQNQVNLGVDALLGTGYTFDNLPFNVSLDWRPSFNFVDRYQPTLPDANQNYLWFTKFGLSARYIIQ